jgi:Tetracyclin repressor-like, C-terminal domain
VRTDRHVPAGGLSGGGCRFGGPRWSAQRSPPGDLLPCGGDRALPGLRTGGPARRSCPSGDRAQLPEQVEGVAVEPVFGQQLARWGRETGADPAARPAVLRLGVLLWSRVHGLVSLELGGAFDSMGIDGELLLTSELEAVTRNGS